MGRRGKRTLINYSFGLPGETVRVLRQNAFAVGLVTTAFLAFLIYLIVTLPGFEASVLRNTDFPARFDTKGNVVNSFILSLRNFRNHAIDISVDVPHGSVVPAGTVRVPSGDMVRQTVYVTLAEKSGDGRIRPMEFVLTTGEGKRMVLEAKVVLPAPVDKEAE